MNLFVELTAQVNNHGQLQNKSRITAEYIQIILAPHNPNETIISILGQVANDIEALDVVQTAVVTTWEEKWEWRNFPVIILPGPMELQAARQFCDTYRNMLKPAGETLDAIDVRIGRLTYHTERLTERAVAAKRSAEQCLVQAIYDYDRIWLNCENTERVIGGTDPSLPSDTVLPDGDGKNTLNQPDTVLPSGEGKIALNRPDAALPPGEGDEMRTRPADSRDLTHSPNARCRRGRQDSRRSTCQVIRWHICHLREQNRGSSKSCTTV